MEFIYEADFAKICRICLYQQELTTHNFLLSIYESPPDWEDARKQVSIVELMKRLAPQLEIPTDAALPQMICGSCLEQLRHAHQFQQLCLSGDSQMQQLLQCYYDAMDVKSNFSMEELEEEGELLIEEDNKEEIEKYTKVEFEDCEEFLFDLSTIKETEDHLVEEKVIPLRKNPTPNEFQEFSDEEAHRDRENNSPKELDLKTDRFFESLLIEEDHSDEDYEEEAENVDCEWEEEAAGGIDYEDEADGDYVEESEKDYAIEPDKDFEANSKLNERNKKPRLLNTSYETYKCDECPKTFARALTYRKHKATHIPNSFECDICDKKYSAKKSLALHKRWYHSTDKSKTHACGQCKKVFPNGHLLKQHIRNHRKTELCTVCGKSFHNTVCLRQHMLRHEGIVRYECPHCPKEFCCLNDLKAHAGSHSKARPHICTYCGSGFGTGYQLKLHLRYHTNDRPFKCDHCDKRFTTASYMRSHMLWHTDLRKFQCIYCESSFRHKFTLMKHYRTHLGDKVFQCKLCPRRFRLSGECREHYATHKGEDKETRQENLLLLKEENERLLKLHKRIS